MSVLVDALDGRGFVDLATFGVILARRTGDLTPAVARAPSVAPPSGFGERVTGAAALLAPRTITIECTVGTDTPGQFNNAVRALGHHCAGYAGGPTGNPVRLSFGTQGITPAVCYTAYLDATATFERNDPQDSAQYGTMRLVFVALDPRALDAADTTIPLGTTAAAVPVGTARERPLVVLDGPFTTRLVTLTDAGGTTRGTVGLTAPSATVLSGHTVEIDCAAETITHVHGGTRTLHPEWLSSGDFFALDLAHTALDGNGLVASHTEGEGDVGGASGVAYNTAFDPVWVDRFVTNTVASYTLSGLTMTYYGATPDVPVPTGKVGLVLTGTAGSVVIPFTPTIQGAQWPYVVLRYKVITGSVTIDAFYSTHGHGYTALYTRGANCSPDGQWHTVVLDMRRLTAGADDWASSAITGIQLFLQGTTSAEVDLNAIAVASAAPLMGIGRAMPRVALDGGTGRITATRGWR